MCTGAADAVVYDLIVIKLLALLLYKQNAKYLVVKALKGIISAHH